MKFSQDSVFLILRKSLELRKKARDIIILYHGYSSWEYLVYIDVCRKGTTNECIIEYEDEYGAMNYLTVPVEWFGLEKPELSETIKAYKEEERIQAEIEEQKVLEEQSRKKEEYDRLEYERLKRKYEGNT